MLGPPASGKTSISDQLEQRLGMEAIRTGHLLRREVERGTDLGNRIKGWVEQGKLAPTESVVQVLAAAVLETEGGTLVFDGFPRSACQIEPFLELCHAIELELVAVLILTLGEEEVRRRLGGRRVCPRCGESYHVVHSPPKVEGRCDRCGSELVRRQDDEPELVEQRMASFREMTVPVMEHFQKAEATRTRQVSAEGDPEEVFSAVAEALKSEGVV